eukprot:2403570-Rhodomonas_salina.1
MSLLFLLWRFDSLTTAIQRKKYPPPPPNRACWDGGGSETLASTHLHTCTHAHMHTQDTPLHTASPAPATNSLLLLPPPPSSLLPPPCSSLVVVWVRGQLRGAGGSGGALHGDALLGPRRNIPRRPLPLRSPPLPPLSLSSCAPSIHGTSVSARDRPAAATGSGTPCATGSGTPCASQSACAQCSTQTQRMRAWV